MRGGGGLCSMLSCVESNWQMCCIIYFACKYLSTVYALSITQGNVKVTWKGKLIFV